MLFSSPIASLVHCLTLSHRRRLYTGYSMDIYLYTFYLDPQEARQNEQTCPLIHIGRMKVCITVSRKRRRRRRQGRLNRAHLDFNYLVRCVWCVSSNGYNIQFNCFYFCSLWAILRQCSLVTEWQRQWLNVRIQYAYRHLFAIHVLLCAGAASMRRVFLARALLFAAIRSSLMLSAHTKRFTIRERDELASLRSNL